MYRTFYADAGTLVAPRTVVPLITKPIVKARFASVMGSHAMQHDAANRCSSMTNLRGDLPVMTNKTELELYRGFNSLPATSQRSQLALPQSASPTGLFLLWSRRRCCVGFGVDGEGLLKPEVTARQLSSNFWRNRRGP